MSSKQNKQTNEMLCGGNDYISGTESQPDMSITKGNIGFRKDNMKYYLEN
jgi:hypothetical protein